MVIFVDDDDIVGDHADCGHENDDLGLLGRTSFAHPKLYNRGIGREGDHIGDDHGD